MLCITTAAVLAAAQPGGTEPVAPERQARAVVRIVRPAIVQFGERPGTEADGAVVRETRTRASDSPEQRLRLVEFY
jgi:hypothetical protein